MKSYYNNYLAMPETNGLYAEIEDVLEPIIKREFGKGYNPSEIMDIIFSITNLTLAELRIRHGIATRKTEREAKQ